jgi:hypothetical protein
MADDTKKLIGIAAILTVMLLGGSLRAIFKYAPFPEVVAVLMLIVGFLGYYHFFWYSKKEHRIIVAVLSRPILFSSIICIAILSASYFIYPIADARRNSGGGSTADDALLLAARSFFHNGAMYANAVDGNIPISTGPGWVLLNSVFANSMCYSFMLPLYIALLTGLISVMSKQPRQGLIFLGLMTTSLLFWELMVTGHDIVAIGCAFTMVTIATSTLAQQKTPHLPRMLALAVLVGLIATSRVVFIVLPLLLALFAWKYNRRVSLIIGLGGSAIALALHAYFYSTSAFYQPFHLFQRGGTNVGAGLIATGLVLESVVVWRAYSRVSADVATWLFGTWLCLFLPLLLIAIGELRHAGWILANWEGANYLFPCIPLFLAYVAATTSASAET